MFPVISQIQAPEANAFMQVMLSMGMIVTIVAAVAVVVNGRKSQRREVTFAQEFATKQEMLAAVHRIEKVEDAISAVGEKLDHEREVLLQAGEARAEKLHKRINRILVGMAKLQGRFNIRPEPDPEGEEL